MPELTVVDALMDECRIQARYATGYSEPIPAARALLSQGIGDIMMGQNEGGLRRLNLAFVLLSLCDVV